jgi:TniQ
VTNEKVAASGCHFCFGRRHRVREGDPARPAVRLADQRLPTARARRAKRRVCRVALVSAPRRCQSSGVSLTDRPFTALGTLTGPLLSWLPDETLFSLCSRLHRLWGYSSSWKSAEVLFGGRRLGLHHDLPSALRTFSSRTGQLLGGPVPIAANRTLLRFYRPFLRPSAVAETVEIMGGPSVAHLKYKLGLLTSRFGANHPLKACIACMTADVERHGWAYWHAEHQFPGVWICPVHASPLRVSTLKHNGVERFSWQLPHDRNLTEVLGAPDAYFSDRGRSFQSDRGR